MSITVAFTDRDGTAITRPDLAYMPKSYSWSVIGGPRDAQIEVGGSPDNIWQLLGWLRYGVTLYDRHANAVWWGYIHEVEVAIGAITWQVSLDTMANNVACMIATTPPGGSTPTAAGLTAWQSDTDSIATYGTKSLMETGNSDDTDLGADEAAKILAKLKWPIVTPAVNGSIGETRARLGCRGWWDTLGWEFYSEAIAGESFTTAAANTLGWGKATGIGQMGAQSFQSAAGFTAENVTLWIQKMGSPADQATVALYTDVAGAPGALLAHGHLEAADISSSAYTVQVATMDVPVALTAGTTYWIRLSREGALSDTDWFSTLRVAAGGYASGSIIYHDGAAWNALAGDINFIVGGTVQTSAILEAAIEDAQFTGNCTVETASSYTQNPYSDGTGTIRDAVEKIMALGVDGGNRYLATFNADKTVTVTQEPSEGSYYYIDLAGQLYNDAGVPVEPESCPVGKWVLLKEGMFPMYDIDVVGLPSAFFLEAAEYNCDSNSLQLEARGAPGPWDILRDRDLKS